MSRTRIKLTSLVLVAALTSNSLLPTMQVQANTTLPQTQNTHNSKDPSKYAIYPIPQSITYTGNEFQLHNEVVLVKEQGVDEYTVNFVKKVLAKYNITATVANEVQPGKTNIILGVETEQGVADAYREQNGIVLKDPTLFQKNDAYLLHAKDGNFVIEGKDSDATYYGVATLQMMFSSFQNEKFLEAQIEDFASVATRGYIEGFYGAWNWQERADLMRFAGNYKMNSYVYAAKGDRYHTDLWHELYPADQIKEIEKLVQVGKETKVKFGWSVHLGSFFKSLTSANETELYNKLIAKIDQLHGVGVNRVDILNDDFGGGSLETVVRILNKLNADLKAKGMEPITYCMQGYNKGWALGGPGKQGKELESMKQLDADIRLYWTGDDVNSPITKATVDFLKEKTNHEADYWLNYPVNEHGASGVYLGDITHYAKDGVSSLKGFHSNPCRFAYANEPGLYQLGALTWNPNNYDAHAQEIWESAFNYLQPEVKDSYLTIARNVSNAPGSSRVSHFPESEYIKEEIARLQSKVALGQPIANDADALKLRQEFMTMIQAVTTFKKDCKEAGLVKNLNGWLQSLQELATAGVNAIDALIALEQNKVDDAWKAFSSATANYDVMYTHPTFEGGNIVAKAGSLRLQPLVAKMIQEAKAKLSPTLNPNDQSIQPSVIARMGGNDLGADASMKNILDGDLTTFKKWQIVQKVGDYVGLDLGKVVTVNDVNIVQGSDNTHDILHSINSTLQYSKDNMIWYDVAADKVQSTQDGLTVTASGLNLQARYIRYRLNKTGFGNKNDFWTGIKEFSVNKKTSEQDRVYTNVPAYAKTALTLDGSQYSLRNLKVTLQKDEYVGIRFSKPVVVKEFVKQLNNNDLTFEYSFDEANWTSVPNSLTEPVGAKYIRLINKTDQAKTTTIQNLGVKVQELQPNPSLLSASMGNGLVDNSALHLFDGDLSSATTTKANANTNGEIIYDLGKTIEISDAKIIMSDGEYIDKGSVEISTDKSTWEPIITINSDTVFTVPYRYKEGSFTTAKEARYLKIKSTANHSTKAKIYELELNKKAKGNVAASMVTSSILGNTQLAVDNDLSTVLNAKVKANDYIEYKMDSSASIEKISVLQGKASTGKIVAKLVGGSEVELGTFKDLSTTISKDVISSKVNGKAITAIRLVWDKDQEIALNEVVIAKGLPITSNKPDVGEVVAPNIVQQGAAEENIAIGKNIIVSGTSEGDKKFINDGITTGDANKWESDRVTKHSNTETDTSYMIIDLGQNSKHNIKKLKAYFHRKIYPTKWEIQVADTNTNQTKWSTIGKELTAQSSHNMDPVQEVVFDTPITSRYIRLFFKEVNNNAGAERIGVKEVELITASQPKVDKSELLNEINASQISVHSKDYTVASKTKLSKAIELAKQTCDANTVTEDDVRQAIVQLQAARNELVLKVSESTNIAHKNKGATVTLASGSTTNINDGNLDTRWDSGTVQKGDQNKGASSYFVIDLGEKRNLIDKIDVAYNLKAYATNSEILVSSDNRNWSSVHSFTRENSETKNPIDSITFDTPISARYIKVVMKSVNTHAVTGVNYCTVKECIVNGRYINETVNVKNIDALADMIVNKDSTFDYNTLMDTMKAQLEISELTDPMSTMIPVSWPSTGVETNKVGAYNLAGELKLSGVTNTGNLKANQRVIVKEASDSDAKVALQYAIKDAKEITENKTESDKYTTSTVTALTNAITTAQGVYDASGKVDKDYTDQCALLKDAVSKLQTRANIQGAQALLQSIPTYNEANYTKASMDALKEAKAALQSAVNNNADINDAQMSEKIQALSSARNNLVVVGFLKDKVSQVEANKDRYTASSFVEMAKLLEQAKALYDAGNKQQLEESFYAIVREEGNLKYHANAQTAQQALDELSALVEADYTTNSWNALKEAKTALIAAKDNVTNVSVDEMNALVNDVKAKKAALVNVKALKAMLQEVEAKKDSSTTSSYAKVETVINDAKALLVNGSAKDIKASINALKQAKTLLQARGDVTLSLDALQSVKDFVSEDYTKASWQMFDQAKQQLPKTDADVVDVSVEQLNTLLEQFKQAKQALVSIKSLKVQVQKLEQELPTLTTTSKNEVSKLMEAAKALYENGSKDAIARSVKALSEVKLIKVCDVTVANEQLARLDQMNLVEANYTKASWQALVSAKQALVDVKNDSLDVSVAELNTRVSALNMAIKNLVEVRELVEQVRTYQAQKLNASLYTTKSWKVYDQAMKAAKALLETEQVVTKQEVTTMLQTLRDAYKQLQKVDASSQTQQPSNPSVPSKPNVDTNKDETGTGDVTSMSMLASMLAASGAAVASLLKRRNKK